MLSAMANPVKAAKQMFDQFLAKHDPGSSVTLDSLSVEPRPAVAKRARKGGIARAASLTPRKRRQIAKRAAKARWAKD